jgi:DNA-binding CsgD family transcriptional regulator
MGASIWTPTDTLDITFDDTDAPDPSAKAALYQGTLTRPAPWNQVISPEMCQDLFLTLFQRSGVCIAILDPGLRLLEMNEFFLSHFGERASASRVRPFCDLLHPSIRQRFTRQFSQLTEGRRARVTERVVCLNAQATSFRAELTGIAAFSEANHASAIVLLFKPERDLGDDRVTVHAGKMLSALDARILEGIAAGLGTIQLARKLYLSRQGVEYHVSAMLRRFRVSNRAALVSKAYSTGIFSVGTWPPRALPEYVR